MATMEQIQNLRRKLQDFYDRDGTVLTSSEQAFKDDELAELIDDAIAEATEGARTATTLTGDDWPMVLLLAKGEGLTMLSQDESRRILWQTNNKLMDARKIPENLLNIAKVCFDRYEKRKRRELEKLIADVDNRDAGNKGKIMTMNSTVKGHYERNFNNATVNRNRSPDHY